MTPIKSVWGGEWGGGIVFVSSMSLILIATHGAGKGNYCNHTHLFLEFWFLADFKRFVYDFNSGIFV